MKKSLQEHHSKICKGGNLRRLKNHEILKCDNGTEFQCKKCDVKFKSQRSVYRHLSLVHSKEKKFKCEKCEIYFTSEYNLNKHTESFSLNEENKCGQCKGTFKSLRKLQQHCTQVHGERKLKCDKCGKWFILKSQLKAHMKKCNGIFRLKDVNSYREDINYKIIKTDQGKSFQCINCEKIFSKLKAAQSHYHREKVYQCHNCTEAFAYQSVLEKHVRKCDGSLKPKDVKPTYKVFIDWDAKKKYQCDQCEKYYENLDNFHQHFFEDHKSKNTSKRNKNDSYKVKVDDEGKKIFHCLKCEKVFKHKPNVLKHFHNLHREKKHKCEKCNKSFSYFYKLLKNHLEDCSGAKNQESEQESKVEFENVTSPMEIDSQQQEGMQNEIFNAEIKEHVGFKTEMIPDCLKTDDNQQDFDEHDPLRLDTEVCVESINVEKLDILGI